MTISTEKSILAGSALILLGSTPAFAVEADAFAQRISAILAEQNLILSYESAEERGDDVVLSDASFSVGDETLDAGDLVFEGVTGSVMEGYEVERFSTDLEQDNIGTAWMVNDLVLEGIEIAGTAETAMTPTISDLYFERAALGEVSITEGDETTFSLTDAEILNEFTEGGLFTSDFDLGDFTLEPAAGEEGDPMLAEALGYQQINGSASGSATWNAQTGELDIHQVQLAVDDAGTLTFSESVSGYTPDFIAALSELQQQMEDQPDNTESWSMALFGLLSQLDLQRLELSYEDASLVDRLLDHYAEQANQTGEQFLATLTTMIPPMLEGIPNEKLQNEIASALSQFLENPQSISITIDPQEPVPAAEILGAVLGAPGTLPELLNVEITVNQ